MNNIGLPELMQQLKKAQDNLERIQSAYADQADLLSFYEPSASFLVKSLKHQLSEFLIKTTGFGLAVDDDIDLWIRIEGEEFQGGKGPIGVVGSFLNKLNVANKFAYSVVSKMKEFKLTDQVSDFSSAFDLAATGNGSLKLGLKRPGLHFNTDREQLDLFSFSEKSTENWDILKEGAQHNEVFTDSINLVLSAIASAEDEATFEKLSQDYDRKDILKVIHFAKELVPSSQSSIDAISFEVEHLAFPKKIIRTNKETRKLLSNQAKKLIPDKEFIHGKGMIRAVDLDEKTITLRPLEYEDTKHEEVKCIFSKGIDKRKLQSLLDKPINLEGFLVFSSNDKLLRLEVEKFELSRNLESEFKVD
ncbi:hypothetical protein [Paenibacillus sp. FSL L8-0158]|uniref:hypothetical protein n=1 Tax=Paenibacillus sp. FSL L8-0158 TaxID=2954752 RepID=UPI0031594B75